MEVRQQVNLIQEVMQSAMKEGTHFGTQPGAKKPSLWKPGAEKLASTFRLAIDPVVDELSYGDEFRIRVKANIAEMGSGRFLGAGVGECSSCESKYMWRAAVCIEEFDSTPETMRRIKWAKDKEHNWIPYSTKQVRMNVADVANTVLKMAKKRAMVDGILTVTGASDIFTQDIEELPKEYLDQNPPTAEPTSATLHPANPLAHNPAVNSDPLPHAHQSAPGEPDIRPRSQKGTQPPTQPAAAPINASPFPPEASQPQGETMNAEPSISKPQAGRFFAIAKSAGLDDDGMKRALASIGLHCHRDSIPRSRYKAAIDAIDPDFRFHTKE